jgi:hypothetical protein
LAYLKIQQEHLSLSQDNNDKDMYTILKMFLKNQNLKELLFKEIPHIKFIVEELIKTGMPIFQI